MRIGLVGCAQRKKAFAMVAQDLYDDDLFRKGRRYVERTCDAWFIISGKHGLVRPNQVLAPYEHPRRKVGLLWGATVRTALRYELSEPSHLVFLIGHDYLEAIQPTLLVGHTFEAPLEGLMYGQRQNWFKRNTPDASL